MINYSYSPAQAGHVAGQIVIRGQLLETLESPQRAQRLDEFLRGAGHRAVVPRDWGLEWIAAVHRGDYLDFLRQAHQRWQALPGSGELLHPHSFVPRGESARPVSIQGQVGYYLSGGSSPIAAGTWQGALASAHAALEAAQLIVDGARQAYALCRPPGHHAYADQAGGFCYLNNAAIAANFLARTLGRVAILDIDAHHGNGTQAIFYQRDDVHYASLHGDPDHLYPFYAGFADERGRGAGLGCNLNLPLPGGSGDVPWLAALATALEAQLAFAPAALLVSLGFDAYLDDPSADLAVTTEGFRQAGALIGAVDLPVLLVQEGGYALEALTDNLAAFLDGLLGARR